MNDATLTDGFYHQLAKVFIDAALDVGVHTEPWENMPGKERGGLIHCLLAVLDKATPVIERQANQKMRKALELCKGASLAPWQQRAVEEALGETR